MDTQSANSPTNQQPKELLRVKLPEGDLTYELVKEAIYEHAKELYDAKQPMTYLRLSSDIFEILDKRLVFKTTAHRDPVHFITPYGNLLVRPLSSELEEPRTFLIEA